MTFFWVILYLCYAPVKCSPWLTIGLFVTIWEVFSHYCLSMAFGWKIPLSSVFCAKIDRTDPAYSFKPDASANKSQSVLLKQSCSIEVASTDHTCAVLMTGFVFEVQICLSKELPRTLFSLNGKFT